VRRFGGLGIWALEGAPLDVGFQGQPLSYAAAGRAMWDAIPAPTMPARAALKSDDTATAASKPAIGSQMARFLILGDHDISRQSLIHRLAGKSDDTATFPPSTVVFAAGDISHGW
jgi:hypothetical protein